MSDITSPRWSSSTKHQSLMLFGLNRCKFNSPGPVTFATVVIDTMLGEGVTVTTLADPVIVKVDVLV